MDDRISSGLANWIADSALSSGAIVIGLLLITDQVEYKENDSRISREIDEFQSRVSLFIPVTPDIIVNDIYDGKQGNKNNSLFYKATSIVVKGIVEMTEKPGMINVVFPEVKSMISQEKAARVISVSAWEENIISIALKRINSVPSHVHTLHTAEVMLVNVTGGEDLAYGLLVKY